MESIFSLGFICGFVACLQMLFVITAVVLAENKKGSPDVGEPR